MANFITYKTPQAYAKRFDEYSTALNLRNVYIISMLICGISIISRVLYSLFVKDISKLEAFRELSINNYAQIICSFLFFAISHFAITKNIKTKYKRTIILFFICYLITAAYALSYIVSLHNTKNTLAALLMGIFMVGLFFSIRKRELQFVVIYFLFIFHLGIFFSDIALSEKLANGISSLLLTIVLYSSSRYNYFLRSNHFIQIKELEVRNNEIMRLNNEKSEILSFVTHDLRAPLNNIEALCTVLLLEQDNTEVKLISNSAIQAKNIINDLIDVIKTNQSAIPKENILLKPYLQQIINTWETNTARKILFTQDNEDLTLLINPSKIERVIDNLISNAIKFSPTGTPIEIDASSNENTVLIKIRDYGIGIPEDMQAHIFDQFSKAGRLGLNGEKSIGLGLHISHKIIAQHQGKLLVNTKEHEGTTFIIQLPLA